MSRRVLVKGDIGQGVGRAAGAVSGAARGAALGSIVPGVGTVLGGIAGAVLGGKAGGKVGDALTGGENITEANNQQSFTDKIKARGKAAADAGAAYAQANQQAQQRMEERGQAMADKAKAGSQIATGEAMDMSWRLLKDVYFGQEFQNPQYAQARQQIIDAAIENKTYPKNTTGARYRVKSIMQTVEAIYPLFASLPTTCTTKSIATQSVSPVCTTFQHIKC
jgi:hypothetical protein